MVVVKAGVKAGVRAVVRVVVMAVVRLAVIVATAAIVVSALLLDEVPVLRPLDAATIPLARMIDVTATVIENETAIETTMTAAAPAALSTETAIVR